MKNFFTIFVTLVMLAGVFVKNANAQITKTVGTTGADYATLKLAFDAINSGGITGTITLQVIDNTSEAATAALNASGTGSASYTSVLIYPTVTGISISGNLPAPLIDLNGADNVTIDGNIFGAADLIISNTSTSNLAGTSTIRFINDATGNTIKYCNIKGASLDASGGVVFFGTTTGTTGNDNNTVTYNNITNAGGNRPVNVIYSTGIKVATTIKDNSGNIISNNNIYDFLNKGLASYGIQLQNYNSNTQISFNSFYETFSFVPTANVPYNVIFIGGLTTNTQVNNNYIGGSAPGCSGAAWNKTNAFTNTFTAINVSSASSCAVQGNIILNFNYADAGASSWTGILSSASNTSIGTLVPNFIGNDPLLPITITGGATGSSFYGIDISGSGNVAAENNVIAAIIITAANATDAANFTGIRNSGSGSTSVNSNFIGDPLNVNSIVASSASTGNAQTVYGIYNTGTNATISTNTIANMTNGTTNTTATTAGLINGITIAGGSSIVSYNTIQDLKIANANNLATHQASISGIAIDNISAAQSIFGNTVLNLNNTSATFAGSIIGLYVNGSATASTVSGNMIHTLAAAASSTANLYGIKINAGTTTYSNNIISLGGNAPATLYGIYDAGTTGTSNLYFNTVYIAGLPTSGTLPSYALYNAATTNTRNFRNNIFSNARSNSGATGTHYAVSLAGTTGLTINYNDYFTSGTGGVLGFLGADAANLLDWQTATSQDANSLNTNPLFALAGGTLPANYLPASLTGVAGTGVLVDFNESTRTTNTMGALETTASITTVDVYSGAGTILDGSYPNLVKAFTAINNGYHFGDLVVKINAIQNLTVPAVLKSGSGIAGYTSLRMYPTVAGLSIQGDMALPLIDLDGATNVTIDGSVNGAGVGGTKDLVINNISTSTVTNTSTIRFTNDASNNTIQNCILKGSETSLTSGVLFFNGTNGATGNDNNLIENNDITCSTDLNRPVNAIYSSGQAIAGLENSGNTINANNIYDFLNRGIASAGVNIYAGSTEWTISGNSFYETTTFAPTAAVEYNTIVMRVAGTFNISGNFIGGSFANCGGLTPWTKSPTNNNTFYGIAYSPIVAVGTTSLNIQGNTISYISYANNGAALWHGIYIGGSLFDLGTVNIGTSSPNIIGAATGNGAITFTSGTGTLAGFYGINFTSASNYYILNKNILNNVIGSITVANTAAGATSFYGIYRYTPSLTGPGAEVTNITNNTIGSIDPGTTNSINVTSVTAALQNVTGISNTAANNHITTISGNTISKLTNASTSTTSLVNGITVSYYPGLANTGSTGGSNIITNNTIKELSCPSANTTSLNAPSVSGISVNTRASTNTVSYPAKAQTVTGNTISNLTNQHATAGSSILGIYFGGTTVASEISSNFIHSFSVNPANTTAPPALYGIKGGSGNAVFSNNIISLGLNSGNTTVSGIYILNIVAANTCKLYFNTVYIGGSVTSSTFGSYGLYCTGTTNQRDIRNNIFDNQRTNATGGTGTHSAATIALPTTGTLVSNYNDFVPAGGVAGQDLNSVSINPLFANPAGIIAQDFVPSVAGLSGITIAGFTTDYMGTTRGATPAMGALEACYNPVSGGTIGADQIGCGTFDPVLIQSLTLPSGQSGNLEYQWQSSTDNITFTDIVGASLATYDPAVISVTTWYKRLARVACKADWVGAVASNIMSATVIQLPTAAVAGPNQTQFNNGNFTLAGNTPSVGTGAWAVVSGPANITSTALPISAVTGVLAGTPAELSWTITNGICSSTSNVILTNTNLTGILKVGPTGNFPSLTNALAFIVANGGVGAGGVILELQSTYLSNVEVFPINFTAGLNTSLANQITVRPEALATGRIITNGGTASHTIYLNSANYVTFDGRPGGAGTASELTITNDLPNSYLYNAIRVKSSSSNSFRYCHISNSNAAKTSSPWTPGATVWFEYNANGLLQNYDNTIDHCSIHGVSNSAAGTAGNLVNLLGSPTSIITNNNFYDFGTKGSSSSYALTVGSSDGTVVTGNSFYQTAAQEITYGTSVIILNGGGNYTVSGNYIGGSAPLCAGGPTIMTFNSFASATYTPFVIATGNTLLTSIQGNTIQNIQATFLQRGFITFFSQSMGKVDIGTVTPNIIGSATDPNSITVINNSPSSEGSVTGFACSSGSGYDFSNFSNNIISGISLTSVSGNGIPFYGINASAFYTAELILTNNTIGSTTLANSINNATPGLTYGINAMGRNLNTITGNTVSNLTQSNTGAANNQLVGIRGVANPGLFHISGNTVKNLNSASTSVGTGTNASVVGIYAGSFNTAGQIISGNTIHSLSNTSATSTPAVTGIYYQGPGGANSISGNFIHNLSLASASSAASITGIYTDNTASVASFSNNMISLGFDAAGTALNTGYNIMGIYDAKGSNSFYNNSVYIGGVSVAGLTSNTYAYISDVITNTRAVQNNIFMNSRSGGTAGQHYAVSQAGITVSPAGLTSSHNLYFTSGTNGMLGRYNNADRATLTAWQTAIGLDNGSINADPVLLNPAGNATTTDLHISTITATPVEGTGTLIASVTTDFDGQLRSTLTPNDIGADAGAFIATPDQTAPSITFTPIANTLLATSPVLTGFATITDNVAVSSGANAPRIYYKKITDANAFAGNTSAANGWKYTVATNASSPYDFTIDYSIINGGAANPGEVIQYFVVAQDDANNWSSNFNGATSSSTLNPIQSINSAPPVASINAYQIKNNNILGTINVPGNYATLTGPSGLFQAINEGTVTGNVNVLITDNLVEPGTYALNQFAAPFTLTIAPASASLKTITANIGNGMIRFFGADNVTIDGRFAGAGKYLEFNNSGTASYLACSFLFTNMANNNTIKYANIKGQNPAGSIIKFEGVFPNTGNSNGNTIDYCDISGTGAVGTLISSYSNVGGANTLNSVTNCNLFDFYHPTNSAMAINLGYGSSDWTITGNSFYQTTGHSTTGGLGVIQITNGTNHLISNNFIGGSAPGATGAPWSGTIGNYFRAIYCFNNNGLYNLNITGNTITNMNLTSTNITNGWYGIEASDGVGSITGNTIGNTSASDAIVFLGNTFAAIQKIGTADMDISYNNIGGIRTNSGFYGIISSNAATNTNGNVIGSTSIANSINVAAGTVTGISGSHITASSCSDNTIANLTSGSGAVKGIVITTTTLNTYTNYTIERNIISNLTSGSTLTGTGGASSVVGLAYSANGTATSISQNQIYNLANNAATGNASITGMYLGSTSGTATVKRNSLYGFSLATTDITASMTGIHINGMYNGVYTSYITAKIQNNLIQLGDGVNTGYAINGIADEKGTTSLYFNTIVLSGVFTGNTVDTYALNSTNTNTRDYRNNIFANNRSGGIPGSGDHYVIKVAGTVPAQAGLTLNYNDYYAGISFTDFKGFFNGTYVPDFATWKTAVGKDINSIAADPLFTSPSNLVPLVGSPAIGTGVTIAGITIDYAGNTRLVPPTMGALIGGDCSNPTDGGTIAADQNGCTPFNPVLIASTIIPSGNSGILEYKWQQSTTSATTGFTDIATSNSDSYDPAILTQTTWFKRLARVSCKGEWSGAASSNVIKITVNNTLPVSLNIAATATTVCAGTSVTFTSTPVNPGANPVYQWKVNGSNVGTNLPTYSYVPLNGNTITCVLTSDATPCASGSPATSNTIAMVVNPITQATVTIFDLVPGAICYGGTKTFVAVTSNQGASPVYQWKVNGTNTGLNMNLFSYIPFNGDVVTCELISSLNCPGVSPAVSNSVTMLVNPIPAAIAGADITICLNGSTTLGAASVAGNTYSWNSTPSGFNSTLANPIVNPLVNTMYTIVETITATGCNNTNSIQVTVNPFTVGGSIAGSVVVCSGTNNTLLTLTGNTGSIVKWQSTTDNWNTTLDISNTTTSYTAVNLIVTTKFRAVILNGICGTVNSTEVVITVDPVSVGGSIAGSSTVCSGLNTTLLTLSGNTGNIIKWQSSTDNWLNIIDIINTSLTYTATNITVTTKYRAVIQSGVCPSGNSAEATIIVDPATITGLVTATASPLLGGQNAEITLTGNNGVITKWQKSNNGGSLWTDIVSTVNPYVEIPSTLGNWEYRAFVKNGVCAEANTIPVSILVNANTTTFAAATNNDWNTTANWNNGIPSRLYNAILPANKLAIVNSNSFECNNLTIAALGQLTINASKDLSVLGTLTLKSDITGTASFVNNGTLVTTSNSIVECYIPHTNTAEFHMLASPVAEQAINPEFFEPNNAFFTWSELIGNWTDYADATNFVTVNGGTNFIPGKGYVVSYPAAVTKNFVGTLNQGSINIPITYTAAGAGGWNFVANPYPSSINWNTSSGWTRSMLEDADPIGYPGEKAIWIWNAAVANYGVQISNAGPGTNGVSNHIAISQGFWVKATNASTLNINNNVREHSSQLLLKTTETTSEMIRLSVTGTANAYSDEMIIKYGNVSDQGGAEKMFSLESTAPGIYSSKFNKTWSISNLTTIAEHPVVAVGFKAGEDAMYTIHLEGSNGFSYVMLEDLKTGIQKDMTSNSDYQFSAQTSDSTNRFLLHFSSLKIGEVLKVEPKVYYNNQYINIFNPWEGKTTAELYEINGKLIKSFQVNKGVEDYSFSLNRGVYIIKMINNNQVYKTKIVNF